MNNTKFWLAVMICEPLLIVAGIYILKTAQPDVSLIGAMFGVITLVAGGYFTSNVVASGQAVSSTTTIETPGKTETVDKPKDGEV